MINVAFWNGERQLGESRLSYVPFPGMRMLLELPSGALRVRVVDVEGMCVHLPRSRDGGPSPKLTDRGVRVMVEMYVPDGLPDDLASGRSS